MVSLLIKWLYIFIAAVVCFFIWKTFAGKSNNWGRIPFILRLPFLVVSVGIAVFIFLLVFTFQRLLPGIIEAIFNIFIGAVCYFAGWDMESVGAVVETVSGIIGDLIVFPLVFGFIFIVGKFPNFPHDKTRDELYKILATIEASGLTIWALFDTKGQLSTLDSIIFVIEIVAGAAYVLSEIFPDNKKNKSF